MPGCTPVLHKGGTCNNDMDCSPSSPLHYRFSTLWLPSFWPPAGCTLRTPFCGQCWNTAYVISSNASTKSFMRLPYSVSCKSGKIMLIMKTLWKTNCNFIKDVLTIYVNFNISSTVGTGYLSWEYSGQGVALTTQPNIVVRLKKQQSYNPIPPFGLTACYRVDFTFHLSLHNNRIKQQAHIIIWKKIMSTCHSMEDNHDVQTHCW